jgi:beta-lactamase class A
MNEFDHSGKSVIVTDDTEVSDVIESRRRFLRSLAGLSLAGCIGFLPDITTASDRSGQRYIALKDQVNNYVQAQRQLGRIPRDERTAWSVYDLSTNKILVAINADVPMQSASMVKPFIALAYFYRHQENPQLYPYDARIKFLMEKMIRNSNNAATNELIARSSRQSVAQKPRDIEYVLKRYVPSIFQQTTIVEYIPSNGRAYRNRSSAYDYSRFLYALWHNRLPYAQELKRHMALPNDDRIRTKARAVPASTRVYDKTGSTARLCGNMGIVLALGQNGQTYPYIFVGIIEKTHRAESYGQWISDRGNIIREVSSLVYQDMKLRYRLI